MPGGKAKTDGKKKDEIRKTNRNNSDFLLYFIPFDKKTKQMAFHIKCEICYGVETWPENIINSSCDSI